MTLVSRIKSNPKLKKFVLALLIPKNEHRPRFWVKVLLNPFKHKRGKGSIVRSRTRMDVFPFNEFNLGEKSIIEDFATVNNGVGNVNIGARTIVGIGNVIIGPVTIGNDVMFAQNIVVSGLNHGYEDVEISPSQQEVFCKQIIIKDSVWIGANSVITAGVTLGKHCVIGGGSVVTKDVPDFSVVVGNPAKIIKQYNHETKIWERKY
ncbi:acyltransferase [Pedobacter fastidiosus]|uniref:Acyltransferase n=1 Tax=Pedobacter fastidiosus TaxID=2765361 RepID=A0ABR7KVR4_9SPHI|nr:acyltransferase [Pedobacter fastidiosus]MBC6112126.1 acyltransferase [Pedobacter fastidiosus]